MEIHYTKHHNTYVTNLNVAHEKLGDAQAKGDINTVIALQPALKFNGGGHLNHSIFWENLAPVGQGGGEMVSGDLENMINSQFGSLDGLKKTMSASTIAIQGSGWGWLGYDKTAGQLKVATCANQDPLEATTGLVPLFGIDVWEHAYYLQVRCRVCVRMSRRLTTSLQYKNVRPDYVNGIWKIVNWRDVAARLQKAK
ncbi:sod-2, partial [Symbiodinium microadriaticum]